VKERGSFKVGRKIRDVFGGLWGRKEKEDESSFTVNVILVHGMEKVK